MFTITKKHDDYGKTYYLAYKKVEKLIQELKNKEEEELNSPILSDWLKQPMMLFMFGVGEAERILKAHFEEEFSDLNTVLTLTSHSTDERFYDYIIEIEGFGRIAEISFLDKKVFLLSGMLKKEYWNKLEDQYKKTEELLKNHLISYKKSSFFYSRSTKNYHKYMQDTLKDSILKNKKEQELTQNLKERRNDLQLIFYRLYEIFTESNFSVFNTYGNLSEQKIEHAFSI